MTHGAWVLWISLAVMVALLVWRLYERARDRWENAHGVPNGMPSWSLRFVWLRRLWKTLCARYRLWRTTRRLQRAARRALMAQRWASPVTGRPQGAYPLGGLFDRVGYGLARLQGHVPDETHPFGPTDAEIAVAVAALRAATGAEGARAMSKVESPFDGRAIEAAVHAEMCDGYLEDNHAEDTGVCCGCVESALLAAWASLLKRKRLVVCPECAGELSVHRDINTGDACPATFDEDVIGLHECAEGAVLAVNPCPACEPCVCSAGPHPGVVWEEVTP